MTIETHSANPLLGAAIASAALGVLVWCGVSFWGAVRYGEFRLLGLRRTAITNGFASWLVWVGSLLGILISLVLFGLAFLYWAGFDVP